MTNKSKEAALLFHLNWSDTFRALDIEDVGRITLAIYEAAETGTIPDEQTMPGASKAVIGIARTMTREVLDHRAAYLEAVENGRKGGRGKKKQQKEEKEPDTDDDHCASEDVDDDPRASLYMSQWDLSPALESQLMGGQHEMDRWYQLYGGKRNEEKYL